MKLIVDLEGNGLYEGITKIWCIVAKVLGKNTWDYWAPGWIERKGAERWDTLEKMLEYLRSADSLIFHNGIAYDVPVIQKFFPTFTPKRVEDTFVLSSLFEPDRLGGHTLEQWGKDLGLFKQEHEDWTQFSPEMLTRCFRDVEITEKVWNHLSIERASSNWEPAIKLEYTMARLCHEMTKNGIKLDIPGAKRLLEVIQGELTKIDETLLEVLPERVVPLFNKTPINKPFKKDGSFSNGVLEFFKDEGVEKYV